MNRKRMLGLLLAGIMVLSGCASGKSGAANPTSTSTSTSEAATKPAEPGEHELVCLEYSSFSGGFPEDGTGRQVENVAAMRIRNDSGRFLDHAIVTCDIGSGTGTFKVTGLPAGASVWVLEKEGKTVAPGERFEVTDCKDYVFRTDAIVETDKLKVVTSGNTVAVTNVSDATLENVCIYYKLRHSDGNFFGGITFMLGFDTLAPGQTAQKDSSHFGADSQIVRYSFQAK